MSAPLNVFPNARSPLFGEGEDSIGIIDVPAVAGLSGDLVIDVISNSDVINPNSTGSIPIDPGVDVVVATTTITVTKAKNTLKIINAQFTHQIFGTAIIKLKTPSTLISSTSGGVGTTLISGEITDLPIGDIDITLTGENGNPGSSFGTYPQISGIIILSEGDDTHAGSIAIAATATKQINVADSHRTREQAVLPG